MGTEHAIRWERVNAIQVLISPLIARRVHQTTTITLFAHVCFMFSILKIIFILFVDCDASTCHNNGNCDTTGNCACNPGFDPASNCSTCAANYYNYPTCSCMYFLYLFYSILIKYIFLCVFNHPFYYCADCDTETCNNHGTCNGQGLCSCEPEYGAGTNCSGCDVDHYNYPTCSCTFCLFIYFHIILLIYVYIFSL
jgi:hypothetical protein